MNKTPSHYRGIAVDIGNSAVHVGVFDGSAPATFGPRQALVLDNASFDFNQLRPLVETLVGDAVAWSIASVNDRARGDLQRWLDDNFPTHCARLLTHGDCPLVMDVEYPDRVGIDRLMAGVAARALSDPAQSAIVIDAGTAITVDCVGNNTFRGGAILPGMRMAAAALDRYTAKLPLVATDALASPEAIGRHTDAAIASGIFWGSVGAIGQLIERMAAGLPGDTRVFMTGGDGRRLADHLPRAEYVPHMVLSGIAMASAQCEASDDTD